MFSLLASAGSNLSTTTVIGNRLPFFWILAIFAG